MSWTQKERTRWVIQNVDKDTVESVKALAASSKQSVGYTLDQAVEYFCRKVQFDEDKPLHWKLPDDF